MGSLDGKVALITGAARGQGRSHAQLLAEEGARIIAVDIASQLPTVDYPMATEDDLAETAELIRQKGGEVVTAVADVSDREQMVAAVDRGLEAFEHIDILVANAGISGNNKSWELTDDEWDAMLRVNLKGVWQSSKAVIPHMIERRTGSLVFTSSATGLIGIPNLSHYGASKHGVHGLMKALALELAEYGIRVNVIAPGNVDTNMIHNKPIYKLFAGGRDDATYEELEPVFRSWHKLDVALIPTVEISKGVLYLVSDMANYVTGTVLQIDAGFTMK
jgi:SDR family mycofactocin-dependent oxidoreductase